MATRLGAWLGRSWLGIAIVALLLGGAAATPTGPFSRGNDEVGLLAYIGDAFYVRIDPRGDVRQTRWIRSEDGLSWAVVDRKDVPRATPGWNKVDAYCAADGTCYRLNDEGYDIEGGNDRQGWVVEYRSATPLSSVAVNPGDSTQALVIRGHEAILYRGEDVTWAAVDVMAATAPPVWQATLQRILRSQLLVLAVGVVLCGLGARRYGIVGRARAVWIGANIVAGLAIYCQRAASEEVPWVPAVWLVVGLAILAVPWPRRARLDTEADLR